MPAVSLTTFVDFVAASGTTRITRIRNAKSFYEEGYAPERDFYKPLRDRIQRCFEGGWSTATLKESLKDVTDPKKIENYEECRKGLTKWVGRKSITSLPPVRSAWKSGGLEVSLNPELHLKIDDDPCVIKLYFKADPLSKQKAELSMELLRKCAPRSDKVGVLDVRRAKLFTPTVQIDGLEALLDAEALALVALWNGV